MRHDRAIAAFNTRGILAAAMTLPSGVPRLQRLQPCAVRNGKADGSLDCWSNSAPQGGGPVQLPPCHQRHRRSQRTAANAAAVAPGFTITKRNAQVDKVVVGAALAVILLLAGAAMGQAVSPPAAPAVLSPPAPTVPAPDAPEVLPPTMPNVAAPALDLQTQLQLAVSPQRTTSTIQVLLLLTVLTLVPSILVLMTSFTRIVVVLGLLRQAMATQQLPPNPVLLGLALFMTMVVMAPVYNRVHDAAIMPYVEGRLTQVQALREAERHVRDFMINQVEAGGNTDDVYLFLAEPLAVRTDLVWADVPTLTLIPAYVVSELKISFLMGFRIYLPFLIIDMVIASVLISMGMLMLPPVLISLPFKLLLFVLVDGWHLVVRTLMMSFGPM